MNYYNTWRKSRIFNSHVAHNSVKYYYAPIFLNRHRHYHQRPINPKKEVSNELSPRLLSILLNIFYRKFECWSHNPVVLEISNLDVQCNGFPCFRFPMRSSACSCDFSLMGRKLPWPPLAHPSSRIPLTEGEVDLFYPRETWSILLYNR